MSPCGTGENPNPRKVVKILFFFLNFFQLYCSGGISAMGNSGCPPKGKPDAKESRYPPNSDLDHGIFNVRTYINASDFTRECTETVTESALKVDSVRKIPCRTGESNLRRWHDRPMLYQLSYILTS